MAEAKTTGSQSSKDSGQALASRERETDTLRRRDAGNWFGSPFQFMDRMADEMDRTFDRLFRDMGMPRRSWTRTTAVSVAGTSPCKR